VLQHWAELTPEQQQSLAEDVRGYDFGFVGRVFAASMAGEGQQGAAAVSPCDQVLRLEVRTIAVPMAASLLVELIYLTLSCNLVAVAPLMQDGSSGQREAWREQGLQLIAQVSTGAGRGRSA
jgi:hypothetical protein